MARLITTDFDFNNLARITNLPDPSTAQHPATKAYVDAARANMDIKESVRAATTANITLSGAQTIDGVSVIAGDRVLVKNQTTGADNGIYVAASGSWTRATDADANAEVTTGLTVVVSEGTANADSLWILATNDPITVGTTSLTFAKIGPSAAGGLSKFSQSVGDGSATSFTVTHNLGTVDHNVQCHRVSDGLQIEADVTKGTNADTIGISPAPSTNQYRVVVIG